MPDATPTPELTVRDVMRPGAGGGGAGQVSAELGADQALSRLLGQGDAALDVVDAGGQVIGSVRLADFARERGAGGMGAA